jgi:hypothetical protein
LLSSPAAFLSPLQQHEDSLTAMHKTAEKTKVNFGILRLQLDEVELKETGAEDVSGDALPTAQLRRCFRFGSKPIEPNDASEEKFAILPSVMAHEAPLWWGKQLLGNGT